MIFLIVFEIKHFNVPLDFSFSFILTKINSVNINSVKVENWRSGSKHVKKKHQRKQISQFMKEYDEISFLFVSFKMNNIIQNSMMKNFKSEQDDRSNINKVKHSFFDLNDMISIVNLINPQLNLKQLIL